MTCYLCVLHIQNAMHTHSILNTYIKMCRYRYRYSYRHRLARHSCVGQRGPAHPCSPPTLSLTPAVLFVSFPWWDEARRAVTQLLGWVVSSQCLAEISPPQHPPFIPDFLFVFVLAHKTKTPSGTAAVEASLRGRTMMTEERCPKVSD